MPNYYNPYFQQPYQQMPQQTQPQLQPQIQSNGFISVPSEEVARNYPVAPGNSVTFKNENAPYVYTKTMGFSQLDRPSFEKYKLVKEDVEEHSEPASYIDTINDEIERLWGEIDALKGQKTTKRKKDGDTGHDEQSE